MKTWTTIDKTDWERGTWDDEPDKAHWIHNGLDCLIVRGPSGALCGYAGVPEGHPLYEMDYNRVYETDHEIEVHGGLTFAGFCQETDDESKGICHPRSGAANKKVWWLGFDCAHSGDYCPKYSSYGDIFRRHEFETYKTLNYVRRQTEMLADQLKEAA